MWGAACSPGTPARRAATAASGSRSPAVASAIRPEPSRPRPALDEEQCPNADRASFDASAAVSGELHGDVDGDGSVDDVRLFVDESGPPGCRAFLVLETHEGSSLLPIEDWRADLGLSEPSLYSLIDIDGRPGSEVLVNLAAGASTQFLGAFTHVAGSLERVKVEGERGGPEDLFAFGGSVGHIEAVDCIDRGAVIISSAVPFRDVYKVRRQRFSFEASALRRSGAPDVAKVAVEHLDRFQEFVASPFGSCTRV